MSLKELCGDGWIMVEPPVASDGENVVARYKGEQIKVGFLIESITDTHDEFHAKYRSGQYNVEVKVQFDVGRGMVRVTEADGYSQ